MPASIDDIVDFALNKDMNNLGASVDEVLKERISARLEDRRTEVAASFNTKEVE